MKLRTLGIGSWFAADYEVEGELRWGTRAEWCRDGWVVVPVKRLCR